MPNQHTPEHANRQESAGGSDQTIGDCLQIQCPVSNDKVDFEFDSHGTIDQNGGHSGVIGEMIPVSGNSSNPAPILGDQIAFGSGTWRIHFPSVNGGPGQFDENETYKLHVYSSNYPDQCFSEVSGLKVVTGGKKCYESLKADLPSSQTSAAAPMPLARHVTNVRIFSCRQTRSAQEGGVLVVTGVNEHSDNVYGVICDPSCQQCFRPNAGYVFQNGERWTLVFHRLQEGRNLRLRVSRNLNTRDYDDRTINIF